MLDQLAVLKLVAARLEAAHVPYMVTGSIASGHYPQPRMTRDIDVVVELQPSDAERLVLLFGDAFECSLEAIRSAIERRGLFNLISFRGDRDVNRWAAVLTVAGLLAEVR